MLAALSLLVVATPSWAVGPLVTRSDAARNGLKRAWFLQLGVDTARSEVSRWSLTHDRLYGVTTAGSVFAIDTKSGRQLWWRQISPPGRAAFGPSANEKFVAVVSGSKLYLLDRNDGRTRWVVPLGSAPGAGPALTESHAYVAMVTGRVEAYPLESPDARPWYYQSKGRAYSQPTTTGRVVSWPTDQGYLYVSRADEPLVLYRLVTDGEIVTSPAEAPPYLYVASLDGYLYCIDEITGKEAWRFSTGYPIEDAPAVVEGFAYVGSYEPSLHAIDITTGGERWRAAGLNQFVARGDGRVYAADRFGNVTVLNAEDGVALGRLAVAEGVRPLVNGLTDRIFLVRADGVVQCLHEQGADEAVHYREIESPAEDEPAEDEANPFEAEPPPAEEAATADQPAEPAADDPVDGLDGAGDDFFDGF